MGSSLASLGLGSLSFDKDDKPKVGIKVGTIDTQEILQAHEKVERTILIKPKEDTIEANTEKMTAYQELKDKLLTYRNLTQKLANDLWNKDKANAFQQKVAINYDDSTKNAITITPTQQAKIGSTTIKVNQIASTDRINSSITFGSLDDKPIDSPANEGNLVIKYNGGASSVILPLTSEMTLQDAANAINGVSHTTGVYAQVMAVGNGSGYRLNLKSDTLAQVIDIGGSDASVLTELGLTPYADVTARQNQLNLKIEFDGNPETTYTSNSIKINGVSYDFHQTTAAPVTIQVKNDPSLASTAIQEWVTTHNDIIKYFEEKTASNFAKDGPAEGATLWGDKFAVKIMEDFRTAASKILSVPSDISGNYFTKLSDIYLKRNTDNSITVENPTALQDLLAGPDYSKIQNFFGDTSISTNSEFEVWKVPTNISPTISGQSLELTYSKAMDGKESASINLNGTVYDLDVDNGFIKGKDNTLFAGFEFGYLDTLANGTSSTSTMRATKGYINNIDSLLEAYTKQNGEVDTSIQGLAKENTALTKEIVRDEQFIKRDLESMSVEYAKLAEIRTWADSINNILNAWDAVMREK